MSKNPKDYSKNMTEDDLLETNAFIHDFSYDVRGESLSRYPSAEQKKEFRKQYDDKLRSESVEYIKTGSRKESADSFNPYIDRDLSKAYDSYETVQSLMAGNIEYGAKRSSEQTTRSITKSESNSDKTEDRDVKRSVTERRSVINIDSRDRDRRRYPYSNDFEVKFRRSYTNVKSVRLISSEFPNTEHAVREYPESIQNNVLNWQNKDDKYGFIYCMYPMYLDGNKLYVECFVRSVNYSDYRDKRTDVTNPIPTRLMIKNCKIRDNLGNEYLLNELNAGGEYFDIVYVSNLDTRLSSFQIVIDMTDYATKAGNSWTANKFFKTTLYSLGQEYQLQTLTQIVELNQIYNVWRVTYVYLNDTYYGDYLRNMDTEVMARIFLTRMDVLAISKYAEIYDVNVTDGETGGSLERKTYTTKLKPGNYLSDSIATRLEEALNSVQTINGDYNHIEVYLDTDQDLSVGRGYHDMDLKDSFGLIIKPRDTDYQFDFSSGYSNFGSIRKYIYDFMIIRSYKHGLKHGDRIRLRGLYVTQNGLPLSFTEDREYYVELLSVYKKGAPVYNGNEIKTLLVEVDPSNPLLEEYDTYIKIYNDDTYELPNILLSSLDNGKLEEPIHENYFLIRINGNYSIDDYGVAPSSYVNSSIGYEPLTVENDGLGTVDSELLKTRSYKYMFEPTNTIAPKIGFQNVNSLDNITKRIEEIVDYRYDSYYSQKTNRNYSVGIRVTVSNHNLQTDDVVKISGTNSVPKIDGEWRIQVINDDHFVIFPHMNPDSLLFRDAYEKYGTIYPLFRPNFASDPTMTIEISMDNGIIGPLNVSSIQYTSTLARSKEPYKSKYGKVLGPLIKYDEMIPKSIDFLLDLTEAQKAAFDSANVLNDAWIQSTGYVISGSTTSSELLTPYSLLNFLPMPYDINSNMIDDYYQIREASFTKSLVMNLNGEMVRSIRVLFEYYDRVDDKYINYIPTTPTSVLYNYYSKIGLIFSSGTSERFQYEVSNISKEVWKKQDYYILDENGNDGYINANPVTLVNTDSGGMTLTVRYNNHSFAKNDPLYITGFEDDEITMIDRYSGYYTIKEVIDKDRFQLYVPYIFPTKDLDHILITSNYHGYRPEQRNVDAYGKIQGFVSLDDDLYVLIVNDRFSAVNNTSGIENILAKINLTGAPGCILYNTFVTNLVLFEDELYNKLDTIRLRVIKPGGEVFEMNKEDYSITLEVIEYVDKLPDTGINSRRGGNDYNTLSLNPN